MLRAIAFFILWSLSVYLMHRLVHGVRGLGRWHARHHAVVAAGRQGWHWNNLLLFNDDWPSTADLWMTEIAPALGCAWLTQAYWPLLAYYLYAALLQERLEHNPRFSLYPWLTAGAWHVAHHRDPRVNFGFLTPAWDILFGTAKALAPKG